MNMPKKTSFLVMICTLCSLSFCFSSLEAKASVPTTDVMQENKPATIKVLLQEHLDKVLVEVKGAHKVYCPYTNLLISSSSSAKREKIHPSNNGLSWGDFFPGSFAIRIVPSNAQTSILIGGVQYKGCVEIYDVHGKIRVINEVDIENYLRSCLATSFCHIKDSEVLNALSIVARTHAYDLVYKHPNDPWHVSAKDEGYQGFANTLQYFPIEQAITATRHAILTYEHTPFAASWSENSGGKTASSTLFKNNASAPQGASIDGMEAERLKSSWSFQISKQELANIAKLSKVSNLALFSEKESGKVYAVKLGDEKTSKTLDFFTLQKALGAAKLKSNDFTLEISDQAVKFKGFGSGHGMGLCIHTAQLMAKQGMDAKKILSRFFKDTQIEKTKTIPNRKEI